MILLKVHDTTWKKYIKSLSKPAQKNWKYVRKHNADLTFARSGYFRPTMEKFMAMWEQQPIRGVKRQWAFPVDHVEALEKSGVLRVFCADAGKERVALHFTQMHHDGYVECHPPMWEKSVENIKRYLGKYMWFNLIKYAIESEEMKWIDFGGGRDDSWVEMIKHRKEYPNPAYKWTYIPEEVKQNPDKQPDFTLLTKNGMRRLEEI